VDVGRLFAPINSTRGAAEFGLAKDAVIGRRLLELVPIRRGGGTSGHRRDAGQRGLRSTARRGAELKPSCALCCDMARAPLALRAAEIEGLIGFERRIQIVIEQILKGGKLSTRCAFGTHKTSRRRATWQSTLKCWLAHRQMPEQRWYLNHIAVPGDPINGGMVVPMHRGAFFHHCFKEKIMGKYFLGWILGVPAIVLVAIYIFMH
jgi:hypothetical protein